jgi:hypothetical protein
MLTFDFSDFERAARAMNAKIDQVPYALSRALNDSAFGTRKSLIDVTWPSAVQVVNKTFMRASLNIEKASKAHLQVAIVDKLGRANLKQHAESGVKRRKTAGKNLAIPPTGTVTRTAKGVRANQRPRALIADTPKRALRITQRGIFVGQGGRLHLRYAFKPEARIKPDVPFYRDFEGEMREQMRVEFPRAMAKAMATRRVR